MLREKLAKIKESIKQRDDGNNKKMIENLVVFVIVLIVTIVIINYIWNEDENENEKVETEENNATKVLAIQSSEESNEETMEYKLEEILGKIKGVGKVNVLITYSQTSQIIPMYSEDISQTTTEENDSSGGNRVVNETSSKKDIIYEEKDGIKVPVTQSTINPTMEGAIVTAQGANNAEIKANIIQAIEAATGLATHKIQVFEME